LTLVPVERFPKFREDEVRATPYPSYPTPVTVAIIGGGFTGTSLAVQLLRLGGDRISVVLVERHGLPGRGVAYSTQNGWHLLNVPARNMSALAEEPEHFLQWAKANHDPAVNPGDFLPRKVYGEYVASLLQEAVGHDSWGRLQWKQDEAHSLSWTGGRVEITLRSGATLKADKVVLALGNFPPSDPVLPGRDGDNSPHYVPLPWSAGALEGLTDAENILLVGSGLTSLDLTISLRQRGFRGTVHIVSRRGLLPHPHKTTKPWDCFWNEDSPKTALGLLKLVRVEMAKAGREDVNWRAVIDSLRPVTQQVWHSLPVSEKRRFLRHVRPYWEIHRHRLAPDIAQLIGHELVNGGARIHAGRITKYVETAQGAEVTYRDRRTSAEQTLTVDRVINCTGPETDCRRLDDPLVANLRSDGWVRPDALYLGLDVSDDGALIHQDGLASDFLYALGPARKGGLWETTAVPEIREQVLALAKLISTEITRTESPDYAGLCNVGDFTAIQEL
jgi:uncharacterized NAD(P)/FAD-binding protein YdhS